MKSSACTHRERRPPGRPGQASSEADGGGERGPHQKRGRNPEGGACAGVPTGLARSDADGELEKEQKRRGGGGTWPGEHAQKGSQGLIGGPQVEGAGPKKILRARSMRGRAHACHALLLQPALRPQRPSFFLRAPGVAAAGVPPCAWQGGWCWALCISARQTRARATRLVRPEALSWQGRLNLSGSQREGWRVGGVELWGRGMESGLGQDPEAGLYQCTLRPASL